MRVDKGRKTGILVIAASIIVAPGSKPVATIRHSVNLARLVLAEVERRG
ncbi:MAG: hypothetical protein ACM3SW_02135 [Actinomycetota bacterium]